MYEVSTSRGSGRPHRFRRRRFGRWCASVPVHLGGGDRVSAAGDMGSDLATTAEAEPIDRGTTGWRVHTRHRSSGGHPKSGTGAASFDPHRAAHLALALPQQDRAEREALRYADAALGTESDSKIETHFIGSSDYGCWQPGPITVIVTPGALEMTGAGAQLGAGVGVGAGVETGVTVAAGAGTAAAAAG